MTKWGLSQEHKVGLILKYCTTVTEEKRNPYVHSEKCNKSIWKNSTPILRKLEIERNVLNPIKDIYWKPKAMVSIAKGKIRNTFS